MKKIIMTCSLLLLLGNVFAMSTSESTDLIDYGSTGNSQKQWHTYDEYNGSTYQFKLATPSTYSKWVSSEYDL